MTPKIRKGCKVILHVGLHKTGTTSIQKTLFSPVNKGLLEKHNFIYPRSIGPNHSVPIYSAFCEHPERYRINIRKGYNLDQIKELNVKYKSNIEMEISKKPQSKLILSGEDISVLSSESLKHLQTFLMSNYQDEMKIDVVIFVRNPISWSISTIQEIIKNGRSYNSAFNHMRTTFKNDFQKRIEKFIQVFGKEGVKVYSFEAAIKHPEGPVGHFLSILGLNDDEISRFNIMKGNESISVIAGDLISYINDKEPLIENGKLNPKRTNGDLVPFFSMRGAKFDIPYDDKVKIIDSRQEDISWLRENYNINYARKNNPMINQLNNTFTEATIEDLIEIYEDPKLSLILKELIIDYMQKQETNNFDKNSKKLIKQFLKRYGF